MRRTQVSDDEPNEARPHFQDWYEVPGFALLKLCQLQWVFDFYLKLFFFFRKQG